VAESCREIRIGYPSLRSRASTIFARDRGGVFSEITSAGYVPGDLLGRALLWSGIFADHPFEGRQNLVETGLPGGWYVAAGHRSPLSSGTEQRVN
jgi:hypothetical protein